ncbi:MAG: FG-GAP repeat protein [Planctomycetes bacterium]|nr:FG-GAP repeat protein [Planctomycetota bacterium]
MHRATTLTCVSIAFAAAASSDASAQSKIFQLAGVSAGDAFGAAASRAGDVDGDGLIDFALASTKGGGGKGYVDLFSGLRGTAIRTLSGTGIGEDFGAALADLGDLDGDGRGELAVGAPLASPNGIGSGRVDVFAGATGGLLFSLAGDSAGDHFGFALARLGDLDGDGVAELAIGAVDDDPNGMSSGSVRVVSGKSGAKLYTVDGNGSNTLFGFAIAALDDQDGDGVADFAIGAPCAPGVQQPGSVRLVSGANGATLQTQSGWFALDGYGSALANAGDVDGDGLDDVLLGAPQTQAQKRGYVQVWTAGLTNLQWDVAGDSNGDAFGAAVAAAGDPDGNGLADFAVGAPGDDDSGSDCGSVRVLSGISGQALFTQFGASAGAKLGQRLDGGFDASGDGESDLLASAPGEGANGAARLVSTTSLSLSTDVHTASLAALGKQSLTLSADPFLFAGKDYALLGSMKGITPNTTFGGLSLPLAFDRYFLYTTRNVSGPMTSARGKLDANGRAIATFDSNVLPKHLPFAGQTFFHAFAVTDAGGQALFVSNAVPITILP